MSIVSVASKIQQYRCDWSFTSFLMIVSSMLIRRRESTHHELFFGNLPLVDIAFTLHSRIGLSKISRSQVKMFNSIFGNFAGLCAKAVD